MSVKVLVESPFRGITREEQETNVDFCRRVCRSMVYEGLNPYASHLFFPQFLDDRNPVERDLGIMLGLEWGDVSPTVYFCLRPEEEMSEGMLFGLDRHQMTGKVCFLRRYSQDGTLLSEEGL